MASSPTLTHLVAATERLRAAAIVHTAAQAAAASSASGTPGGAYEDARDPLISSSSPTSMHASLQNEWNSHDSRTSFKVPILAFCDF